MSPAKRSPARRPPAEAPARIAATGPRDAYVLLASFVAGASVLVVEIVGTRVISPYYGASVYVWSSLIGVTLAALATGYVLGGWAADRRPHLPSLALEMIAAALSLLLVPWLRRGVLVATTPLGLEAGSLASAAILFAPSLVLLGMTGPAAIRLVTSDFTVLGRGVGKIYGVSTVGSMLGAIGTGFVLLPSFSVPSILGATAALLLVVGGAGLALERRTLAAAAPLAAAFLAVVGLGDGAPRRSNVLWVGNSFHGELKVVDSRDTRVLLINGVDNGLVDRISMEPRAPYITSFDYLPAARPTARRALCIGLGAGSVPRAFHLRHGLATEVVEIDAAVVPLARRFFGFPPDVPVAIEDGRTFIRRTPHRYDFVVLDAFQSESHPGHLFTREFFAGVDAVLEPGGIVAVNMAALPTGPAALAWRSVHRTLAERFRHVRAFAGEQPDRLAALRYTNLFLVASHAALPAPAALGDGGVFAVLARTEIVPDASEPAHVLTDDYNPVDDLQRSVLVAWRQDMIRNAREVLLFDGTP